NCASLAVALPKPHAVYAGSQSIKRIRKSTDGGKTWQLLQNGLTQTATCIAPHPRSADTVYAAGGHTVHRSTNGGADWSVVFDNPSADVRQVCIDSFDPKQMFLATSVGAYRSTDGGTAWTSMNMGLTSTDVYQVDVAHGQSRLVIFSATAGGVYQYMPDVPKASLMPEKLYFFGGETTPLKILHITNIGTDRLSVRNIRASDPEISADRTALVLPPGGSDSVFVALQNGFVPGPNAHLVLETNDPLHAEWSVPVLPAARWQVRLTQGGGQNQNPKIVASRNGAKWIFWESGGSDTKKLCYTKAVGRQWDAPSLLLDQGVRFNDYAVSPDPSRDGVWVAYTYVAAQSAYGSPRYGLKLGFIADGAWQETLALMPPQDWGDYRYPQFGMDGKGRIHFSVYLYGYPVQIHYYILGENQWEFKKQMNVDDYIVPKPLMGVDPLTAVPWFVYNRYFSIPGPNICGLKAAFLTPADSLKLFQIDEPSSWPGSNEFCLNAVASNEQGGMFIANTKQVWGKERKWVQASVRQYDGATGTKRGEWSFEEGQSNVLQYDRTLAADSNRVAILYYNSFLKDLWIRLFDGTYWHWEQPLTDDRWHLRERHPSACFDSEGFLWAAYDADVDGGSDIFLAETEMVERFTIPEPESEPEPEPEPEPWPEPEPPDTACISGNRLFQNFPNPVHVETEIGYVLSKPAQIRVCIYAVTGRRVRILLDAFREAGFDRIFWDGRDTHGRAVGSGIYLCVLNTDGYTAVMKMVMLR
ncbi:MAG TPA: hypothetical protein VGB38_06915, partial [bacterium]